MQELGRDGSSVERRIGVYFAAIVAVCTAPNEEPPMVL